MSLTLDDLVANYGYPADRVIRLQGIAFMPSCDTRAAKHWMQTAPAHQCNETIGSRCVAVHYPGGWPAFLRERIEKRDAA